MFSALFYLLLTISIVTKYSDCYVVDNSASMRNEVKSEADDRRSEYFDSNNNNDDNHRHINEVGNHIRTSAINVTAIDNAMEMPKPNVAVDYSIFQTSRDSDDALAEVETGELLISKFHLPFLPLLFLSMFLFRSRDLFTFCFSFDWLGSIPSNGISLTSKTV